MCFNLVPRAFGPHNKPVNMAECPPTHPKPGDGAQLLPCGYDEDFINPTDDDLQCLICFLPLREPVLTKCGHRFCRECLEHHMTRQESQKQVCSCPVDREELVRHTDIFRDKATERKILSLVIKCASADCEWTGELREEEIHLSSCSFQLVPCTNNLCEVRISRKDLHYHVNTICQWRIVACEHCTEPHPKWLLQAHVDLNCKKKPVECPNSCGELIVREEITSHINNDCPLTEISCPYAQMGCSTKILRKEVQAHLQSTTRLHLDLTCATFKETTGKLEQTVKTLEKKVQELTAANSALNSMVDAQKKDILRLSDESTTFVWKVDGFSEILKQAKSGSTVDSGKIYSEPFYAGKQGYRLRMCIFPDGDQTNKNRYLSVFIAIMKGKYDAILLWPFNQKVTFMLIDQEDDPAKRKNLESFFVTDTSSSSFARPTTDENEGLGVLRFVSHKNLKTRRYVVDDTLFLQVKIDPPN